MSNSPKMIIEDLHVAVEDKEILKGVNLEMKGGEIHAIMGPNGTGKSTLAPALMGHPRYEVTAGSVTWTGKTSWRWSGRAGRGIVPRDAVSQRNQRSDELRFPAQRHQCPPRRRQRDFPDEIYPKSWMKRWTSWRSIESLHRYLNEGFSGGEKKRNEILQMMMLEPRSSFWTKSTPVWISMPSKWWRTVSTRCASRTGFLIITHYQRLLNYIKPDYVHVMMQGRIVKSGGPELAERLEAKVMTG